MNKKEQIIDYLLSIDFTTPPEHGTTWKEIAEKFDTTSETARTIWKRFRNAKPKTSWQVQAKGGEIKWLHSYRHEQQVITEEDIVELFSKLENVTPKYIESNISDQQPALIVFTSDKHIGAQGSIDNQYNEEVILNRISQVTSHIIKLASMFGGFSLISIVDLGDATDGYKGKTDRQVHDLEQNMNDKEIFEVFMKAHTQMFEDLYAAKCFDDIEFHGLANSNHASSIDYMCFRSLEYMCASKYPEVNFNIYTEHENIVEIYGKQYLLMHGKDEKYMKQHYPLVTNDKAKSMLKSIMLKEGLNPGCRIIKGDLHTACSETTELFQYRNIGSMFGASNYIKYNFGDSIPSVGIEIIIGDDILENTLLLK